jgi:redox-sensitive bicupin YhaK (pirin superfamily)
MTSRSVVKLVDAHSLTEGEGFPIRRPFPTSSCEDLDPFLMLDEVGPVQWPPGEALGAPDHPHRGFETISYVLSGEKLHEDSTGKTQIISAGDVQWMTAGAGIVHSEMPSAGFKAKGGKAHSFQIWVNLPASQKLATPGYQYVSNADIPLAEREGISVKVIAGEVFGVSARIGTHTPVWLQDWSISTAVTEIVPTPRDFNFAVYVFKGAISIGSERIPVVNGQMAILSTGTTLLLNGHEDGGRFLLLAGKPLNEPVARYGPFVMNTKEELISAFEDYQTGRIGRIQR